MCTTNLIIFTDLDGTLLDHHTYRWQEATPALAKLRQLEIPVILTTSKTAAEVDKLHRELRLRSPYIVENGAGIIFPKRSFPDSQHAHYLSKPYSVLLGNLQRLRRENQYRFLGFSDFSVADIMAVTGLPEHQAAQAKQRLCSEPLLWNDTDQALCHFKKELDRLGLQLQQGGRFYHVLDKQADKGTALQKVLNYYRQQSPHLSWEAIALGDGPNDQSMLEAADLAVIIPSASGVSPVPRMDRVMTAHAPGPAGWNQVILKLLAEHDL